MLNKEYPISKLNFYILIRQVKIYCLEANFHNVARVYQFIFLPKGRVLCNKV